MSLEKIPYDEGRGYSLWLMPNPSQSNQIGRLIKKLSKTYASPVFKPHMTLLGSILMDKKEIIARATMLSGKIKAMNIDALRLSEGPLYFKSLFIEMNRDPNLSKYYSATCKIFSQHAGKFNPHISLLYGRLGASERKRAIKLVGYKAHRITFNKLCVFDTSGKVKSWKKVASFPLK